MTWLRGLGQDLIDKRLWPIALVLGIAIIAAPTVLARGGSSGDEVAVTPPATQSQGLRAAVVQTAEPGDGPATGGMRNPFFDAPSEEAPGAETQAAGAATDSAQSGTSADMKSESSTGTSTSGSGDSGSSDGSSGSGGSENSGGDSGSSDDDDSGSTTKGSGEVGYDLTVKFGAAGGEVKTYKNVPRLSPLPDAENPMFIYMGVLDDGKTAVFLMGDGIGAAVGDGTCRPSPDVCETLELDKGDTMFLDGVAPTEGGTPAQYQLDVTSIVKRGGSKKASSASKKARKAAKAGRSAVRKARRNGAADTLDRYRFDAADGVIRRLSAKQRGRAKAKASSRGALKVSRTGHVVASAALLG